MLVGNRKAVITWLMDQPEGKMWKVTEFREKRSLDSNSYYWELLSQLKDVLHTSSKELHEQLLQRYSVPVMYEERPVTITIKDGIPLEMLPGHWMPVRHKDGFTSYMQIKGSSEMDSKEMSNLIDGLVSECKEVGIETMTPQELKGLKGYGKVEIH